MTKSHSSLLCVLVAASSLFGAAPSDARAICPRIFRPVCAVTPLGVNQTFPNSCEARVAHARILAPGQCQGPICPFIFQPVCARIPGQNPRTFPNLCIAETDHATLLHTGPCN